MPSKFASLYGSVEVTEDLILTKYADSQSVKDNKLILMGFFLHLLLPSQRILNVQELDFSFFAGTDQPNHRLKRKLEQMAYLFQLQVIKAGMGSIFLVSVGKKKKNPQ